MICRLISKKYHFLLVGFFLFDPQSQPLFRCTEKYDVKAEISIFGIPIWHKSNTPRSVITPTMQPGECWSFRGFPGYLVLKLSHPVYVTGFTMEHIPKSIAPGGIDSAPKSFTVWVKKKAFFLHTNQSSAVSGLKQSRRLLEIWRKKKISFTHTFSLHSILNRTILVIYRA